MCVDHSFCETCSDIEHFKRRRHSQSVRIIGGESAHLLSDESYFFSGGPSIWLRVVREENCPKGNKMARFIWGGGVAKECEICTYTIYYVQTTCMYV